MESKVLTFQTLSPPVWKVHHSAAKRLFDLTFSLAFLILFFPLFLGIACTIRLTTRASALYVQPRIGRGGRIFRCYKFRTMYPDAESRLDSLLSENPTLRSEWIHHQKLKHDPRIFPLGRWLRRTSLDELPQFWNVIKGDLSVVGPRPYMVQQKQEVGTMAAKILSVKPGLTGLWQTSGRSRTTFRQRIVLDARYIDKRSFWFDLVLIFKTIYQILFLKDAC